MKLAALTRTERLNIYRAIERTNFFDQLYGEDLLNFVHTVTDLYDKRSTDSRYNNLYEDINKHIVLNYDYSIDEVLIGKVDILADNVFEKFLSELLNENWYSGDHKKYMEVEEAIRHGLMPFNLTVHSEVGENGLKKSIIENGSSKSEVADIEENRITIVIDPAPSYPSNTYGNHFTPTSYPSLVLAFDSEWNDYFSYHTQFDAFYHASPDNVTYIGKTKVIVTDKILDDVAGEIKIIDFLPQEAFFKLTDSCCSLGQMEGFYTKLRDAVNDERKLKSLLWALRDVGFFPTLQERYEDERLWISISREKNAQKMLRHAPDVVAGDYVDAYNFEYIFRPPYNRTGSKVNVNFNFNSESTIPTRLIGLIGKNGSGKTRLLSSIPQSLAWRRESDFKGRMPRFGKIIALSNSHYDNFDIPEGRADFNYIYCGLSEMRNGRRESMDINSIIKTIVYNCNKITGNSKKFLIGAMEESADKEMVAELLSLIEDKGVESLENKAKEDDSNIFNRLHTMSSGELGMLYLFSSLLANIRYDSLVLFDEPENHLHPNSISHTVAMLYKVLERFESYAIVATHSPIVIEAIRAENVLTVRRESDTCLVRKIGMESLGANLSDITDHVFGSLGLPLHYKAIINRLRNHRYSFDEIEAELQSGSLPLSLPVRCYLDSLALDNN